MPLSGVLHPWARAGHHRFPGNPSYALALLQDPGRADKTSPLTASSILPPGTEHRRPQRIIISRLTQGFSIRCLRFKSGVAAAPEKLASGWRAAPLPEGVEPSGLLRKVSGYIAIPLSRTSPVAISFKIASSSFLRRPTLAIPSSFRLDPPRSDVEGYRRLFRPDLAPLPDNLCWSRTGSASRVNWAF